jgi:hypothetical protein
VGDRWDLVELEWVLKVVAWDPVDVVDADIV